MKRVCKCVLPVILSLIVLVPQFTGRAAETADFSSPSEAAVQATNLGYGKTYYLRNAKSGMYLDLQYSGVVNSTHFQQYPGHYPSELFYFNYQGGYYAIETTLVGASGRMVMDGRKNCVAGAQVILYQYVAGAEEQLWFVQKNANGTYCLSPKKNTSLNLAVEGGSLTSNAKVKLAAKNGSDASQQWYIEEPVETMNLVDYGTYYLRNKNSGLYLDLQGNGTTNGTHFQQYTHYSWPCAERFWIVAANDGYFTVESTIAGGMVMDGRYNCVAGAQVVLYQETSNAPEQHWHLHRNGNGTFSISPKKNVYLNLAVAGGSYANNAKVVLTDRNYNDPNQQWCLEPAYFADYDWQYVLGDANTFSHISSGYLELRSDGTVHYGIDIVSKTSTSIAGKYLYTPMDGKVVYKIDHPSAGNYVVIETDCFYTGMGEKLRVGFMHMEDPCFFGEGTRVEKGDHIGYVGSTGESTGYHLHLCVYRNKDGTDIKWADGNNRLNPQRFFPGVPFTGATSSAE